MALNNSPGGPGEQRAALPVALTGLDCLAPPSLDVVEPMSPTSSAGSRMSPAVRQMIWSTAQAGRIQSLFADTAVLHDSGVMD
ncbi:hypothetical protein NQZ68_024816 [Dissostichus eleginoides]|nr:hypothetical protein NQZ68_024816 [Dissostichus eleginoides]